MNDLNFDVDIVIPWVNGNDPEWIQEKQKYICGNEKKENVGETRFRDWEVLKYWFRSIEKNVPWINKIYFVTWGHIPKWLNINNKKLVIVNHKDYIPQKYLPVFSSNPIDLNMHRIDGLSEHFIYMNDDTFIMEPIKREFYFDKKGRPCQLFESRDLCNYAPEEDFPIINFNNMGLITRNFNKRNVPLKHVFNWKYGIKANIYNINFLIQPIIPNFYQGHMPAPFLKSTFIDVWEKEYEYLDMTCQHKFRNYKDVNQWLMQYWQLSKGTFCPSNPMKFSKLYVLGENEEIYKAMKSHKYKILCLNDSEKEINFEVEKERLINTFEILFPDKSSFEI